MAWIPCQCCHQQYTEDWTWYVCDECGFRICTNCLEKHSGPYGNGGFKCSQCMMGHLRIQHGVRTSVENPQPVSKLDEYLLRARGGKTSVVHEPVSSKVPGQQPMGENYRGSSKKDPSGLIFTNTSIIARKYKNTSFEDVRNLIFDFMKKSENEMGFIWDLVDLGSEEMAGAVSEDSSWMDYAQMLSDYTYGMGIRKSAQTSLFIIGGSDVIPMPEFYASVGHDVKTIEDSDLLYCFPIDYEWKRVAIDDAIFNIARLPLDFVERGTLSTTVQDDLGKYFQRAVESMSKGIPLTYAMMTANAGKNGNNDWTWASGIG